MKAENIKRIVKEAINLIEKDKPKKTEKRKVIEKTQPIRTTSQPPIRKLETIQERMPTYADLRREKMERKSGQTIKKSLRQWVFSNVKR